MKRRTDFSRIALVFALAIALLPVMALAQGAKIRMPDFSGLAEKAKESVDISLDGEALKSAGSLLNGGRGGPNQAQFAELVKGLQGIYIKVFEFDKPGQYSMRDIENVVRQVERDGWKKLLAVRDGDERVEMWIRDGQADGGMFFFVTEPDELVMINIVGNINLDAIRQLQGTMGIPNIPGILGQPARPQPAQPAQPARPAQPAQPAQPTQPPQPAQPPR